MFWTLAQISKDIEKRRRQWKEDYKQGFKEGWREGREEGQQEGWEKLIQLLAEQNVPLFPRKSSKRWKTSTGNPAGSRRGQTRLCCAAPVCGAAMAGVKGGASP